MMHILIADISTGPLLGRLVNCSGDVTLVNCRLADPLALDLGASAAGRCRETFNGCRQARTWCGRMDLRSLSLSR
jgi:hypothetical protein